MRAANSRLGLWLGTGSALALLIIVILNFLTGPDSTEEWIYTVDKIDKFAAPALLAVLLLASAGLLKKFVPRSGWAILFVFLAACLFLAVPLLSPPYLLLAWHLQYLLSFCWAAGLLLFGIGCFIVATRMTSVKAFVWCLAGSLLLSLGLMEALLLFTSQTGDGLVNASAESQYVESEAAVPEPLSWQERECGTFISPATGRAAHRLLKFDQELFDTHYGVRDGRRRLPDQAPDASCDLLLFGCSYTFGHSLSDEVTWAWQLAGLLGRDWHLENYAMIGHGASQMLCLLEHDFVKPLSGKRRYALFLAMDNHIRRNEFYPHTPHYTLSDAGEAVRGGSPAYGYLFKLGRIFNGSQLARETSGLITAVIMQKPAKMVAVYLATLKKSAEILRSRYDTELLILLWPDLEYLREDMLASGLHVLSARDYLTGWDSTPVPGDAYYIHPTLEVHPNELASRELAIGLAGYFQSLTNTR